MGISTKAFIDRYEIVAELGRGAMGIVYQARDPKIDRLVAIKTISLFDMDASDEEEYRERFYQEARTAGRLSHRAIVTIFDVGTQLETNAPYIVMEYVAGRSLSKLLAASGGPLPLNPALQLAQEMAEALHYAHSEGVVHRDIKPANILLTQQGQAKLADFGIARLDQSHLTLPGRIMGSPAYMAPEQLNGEAVDGRSDLFSLGVVLYTVLTGHRPFQGNSTATVCFKLANQAALPASAWNPELPDEVDRLLARAMAKDPAQRFQNGIEMARALRQCRENQELPEDTFAGFRQLIERPGISSEPTQQSRQSYPASQNLALVRSTSLASVSALRRLAGILGLGVVALVLCGLLFWLKRDLARPVSGSQATSRPGDAAAANPIAPQTTDETAHSPQPQRTTTPKWSENISTKTSRRSPMMESPTREAAIVPRLKTASLDIIVEHGFQEAQASLLVDNRPVYNQELRGVSRRRGVLFHKTEGSQSGNITVTSGKHDIRVLIQSAEGDYEATKTFSRWFAPGSRITLRVKCDKRQNRLALTIQPSIR